MSRWLFLPNSVYIDLELLGNLRAEQFHKLKTILDSEAGKRQYAIYLQIVEELGISDQDAARLHSFWEYVRDEQARHERTPSDVIDQFVTALESVGDDRTAAIARHLEERRPFIEDLFGEYPHLDRDKCAELESGPIPHLASVKSYCDVRPVYNRDGSDIVGQVAMITLRLGTHSEHLDEYNDVLILVGEHDLERLDEELRRIQRKLAAIKKNYPGLTVPKKAHKGRKVR